MSGRHRRGRVAGLRCLTLDDLYSKPDPFRSIEEYWQYYHLDLSRLSVPGLLLEQRRLEDRLRHDPRPHDWFLRREDAIRREKRRRV